MLLLGAVGAGVGLFFGVVLAFGDDSAWIVLGRSLLGAAWGVTGGALAGLAHGVALLPVVLRGPRRPLPYVRVVAAQTSAGLLLLLARSYAALLLPQSVAYVLLSPSRAARAYAAASAVAAESAARRKGASRTSRVSGSASASSRASSE